MRMRREERGLKTRETATVVLELHETEVMYLSLLSINHDDDDDDDDIYVMVKCVSVCLSAKVIFSEVSGAGGVFSEFVLKFSFELFFWRNLLIEFFCFRINF